MVTENKVVEGVQCNSMSFICCLKGQFTLKKAYMYNMRFIQKALTYKVTSNMCKFPVHYIVIKSKSNNNK